MRNRRVLAMGVAVAAGISGLGAAVPAQADCVYVVVHVTREDTTPLMPTNGCVVNTPWKQRLTAHQGTTHENFVPSGVPNGYFVDVRLPVPG